MTKNIINKQPPDSTRKAPHLVESFTILNTISLYFKQFLVDSCLEGWKFFRATRYIFQ